MREKRSQERSGISKQNAGDLNTKKLNATKQNAGDLNIRKLNFKKLNVKKLLCLCLSVGMCSFSACSLAVEEGGRLAGEDELIGMYVTLEHVDIPYGSEPEVKRTSAGDYIIVDEALENGRLYGELDPEANEVRFPGIEGYAFLTVKLPMENGDGEYVTSIVSDRFYDIKSEVSNENMSMKGVIAYDNTFPSGKPQTEEGIQPEGGTQAAGSRIFYANPVYMTQDGKVYLMNLPGMGGQSESTVEISYQNDFTENSNGEGIHTVKKFTLSIQPSVPLASAVFSQMTEKGTVLRRDEYLFEQLPEQLDRESETSYTLVELKNVLGEVSYDVLNREDTEYRLYGSDGNFLIRPFLMQIR